MTILLTRESERFEVPDRLPVIPLRDVVVYPYMVIPLLVGRPASVAAIEAAMAQDRWLLLVAQRSGDVNEPTAKDLFRVGVVARVQQMGRPQNGATKVLFEGVARVRVTRYQPHEQWLMAQVEAKPFRGDVPSADEYAQIRRAVTLFDEYVAMHRRIPTEVSALVQGAQSADDDAAPAHSRHCCGKTLCTTFAHLFKNINGQFDKRPVIAEDSKLMIWR